MTIQMSKGVYPGSPQDAKRPEKTNPKLRFGNAVPITAESGTTDMFTSSQLPETVSQLVRQILTEKPDTPDRILYPASQTTPELSMIRPGYYQCGDFQILSGLEAYTDDYVQILKEIGPLNLSSAPQLVHYVKLPEAQTSLVITRMPGCDVRELRPFLNSAKAVTEEGRTRFLSDMQKLLDANQYHPDMVKPPLWHVNPNTRHIILDEWSKLQKLSDSANKSEILAEIARHLK